MKDPAFLFYTSDFLTGTMLFTHEQTGKYIRLLCLQHQQGRLTIDDMNDICGTYDKRIFDKFKKDAEGLYYNERLENEILRRKNYCESRRNNRSNPKKKPVKHLKKSLLTYVEHMENVIINENIKEIVIEWLKYKSLKKKSYKSEKSIQLFVDKLNNLSNNNPLIAKEIIETSMSNNWDGIFPLKQTNNNGPIKPKSDSPEPDSAYQGHSFHSQS